MTSHVVDIRATVAVLLTVLVLKASLAASSHPEKRIINGKDAKPNAHPSLVTVKIYKPGYGTPAICGGVLVDPSWVLTAAHCVVSAVERPSLTKLEFGNHFLNTKDEGEIVKSTPKVFLHPEWINGTGNLEYNDIALVKLWSPLELEENKTEVAQMADQGQDFYGGRTCTQAGWGETETGEPSETLKQHNVIILDDQKRNGTCPYDERILCVVTAHGENEDDEKSSSCRGDSGSPLMCDGKVVGLHAASWRGCPVDREFFSTSVAPYKQWIENTINCIQI